MRYVIYFLMGIVPSLIWLIYYLKKDKNPESKRMIIKVFILGMLATFPAIVVEKIFQAIIPSINTTLFFYIRIFIGVALVEEFFKYLMAKIGAFSHREFDEPVDTLVYMIVSALGFAALENIFLLFSTGDSLEITGSFVLIGFRFIGATLLHALVSGTFGYFLALSFCYKKARPFFFIVGIGAATLLHGAFNFSIISDSGINQILVPALIIAASALFLSKGFKRLNNIKSICKL
jgi:RsiW-degrading membrane proteinase PrsW (M82 family)